jgi:hypothetical protein
VREAAVAGGVGRSMLPRPPQSILLCRVEAQGC